MFTAEIPHAPGTTAHWPMGRRGACRTLHCGNLRARKRTSRKTSTGYGVIRCEWTVMPTSQSEQACKQQASKRAERTARPHTCRCVLRATRNESLLNVSILDVAHA